MSLLRLRGILDCFVGGEPSAAAYAFAAAADCSALVIFVGGGESVKIQSMCTTRTSDVDATVEQICALEGAGCEISSLVVLFKLLHDHLADKLGGNFLLHGIIDLFCDDRNKAYRQ